jgi:hypothetical protein
MKFSTLISFVLLLGVMGCKRTLEKLPNQAPDTVITPESINLSGDDRLNSVVFLSWYGTDPDGYVTGYEISLDNQNWLLTTSNDSIFSFTLEPGSDTTDIEFYVRSIDNEGLIDASPAFLKVPLKNSAPVATFTEKSFPPDSVNIVTTFVWEASDVDGDETIIQAFIKANEGDWLEIDVNQKQISLVPTNSTTTGTTNALVYYGTSGNAIAENLTGLRLGDTNIFYVKVVDFANAESVADTSESVFIKPKTADVLYVSGLPDGPSNIYHGAITSSATGYDFANYYASGGEFQPRFWSPTFDLLLTHYSTLIFTSDESSFTNAVNGRKDVLLEFAAPSIQIFTNNGGKSLVVTSFAKGQDITGITSTLPIDSLSSSVGQARLFPDSAIVSSIGAGYPDLKPTNIISGLSPFYMSTNAEEVYNAQLTAQSGWTGPTTVGARRKVNGNIYQYFFSVQLYKLDQQISNLHQLFDQILNNDFNW